MAPLETKDQPLIFLKFSLSVSLQLISK